jgi:hypothetical protein
MVAATFRLRGVFFTQAKACAYLKGLNFSQAKGLAPTTKTIVAKNSYKKKSFHQGFPEALSHRFNNSLFPLIYLGRGL